LTSTSLTALIHTLNEVDQIEACIRSVEFADEIYLLDSFSTDGTVELVRERFPQVRIEQRTSLGSAAQKNYGMDHAANEWILVVDADERVTPELRTEIQTLLGASPDRWAYSIGRRNFVFGTELHYSGLQHDRVTRLFHRQHARYPNRRVHAALEVDGQIGRLEGKLEHYYVRSFDHMIEKMTRYGFWGATQKFIDGQDASAFDILSHAGARFFRDYFLRLGVLDGAPGLIVVGMHTYYEFWKYAKLWEFNQLKRAGKPVPLPELDQKPETWNRPWETQRPPDREPKRG
jgi:glycosyltransferase involved in cell wall biosynthesis